MRTHAFFVMLVLTLALPAFAGEAAAKAPVPEAAKVAEAEKTIKDIFKDEYAKRGVEDRKALAQKLLQQGDETKDDAASRYVLLKEAAALAVQGGDAETVLKALDGLGAGFEVDALALKADALGKIAPASADAAKALTRTYLKVIDEAVAADSYDVAVRLSSAADTVARKTQDMPLVTQLVARGKEVRALQADFAKVKAAQATLKEKPDDPEANLAVGKFLCFTKGDWEKGLPLLAKGSDAKLKEVAEKELAASTDVEKRFNVADEWWAVGEKIPGGSRTNVLEHAATMYEQALGKVSALQATRVKKRISTLRPVNLIYEMVFSGPGQVSNIEEGLRISGDHQCRLTTKEKLKPPFRVEAIVQLHSKSLRLYVAEGLLIFNWEDRASEFRFHDLITGQQTGVSGKGSVPNDEWLKVSWQIDADKTSVFVDDVERFSKKGDYKKLDAPFAIAPAYGGSITLKSVTIK